MKGWQYLYKENENYAVNGSVLLFVVLEGATKLFLVPVQNIYRLTHSLLVNYRDLPALVH